MTVHPLDVDLVEMGDHLRLCSLCRRKLSRIMYPDFEPDEPDTEEDEEE
jgi:hypothetical protein